LGYPSSNIFGGREEMPTLEEIKTLLADRNLSEVSRRSGVPYAMLYKFATGRVEPKYETIKVLAEYLQGQSA
jgi:predicted transcriptional regulator